MVLRHVGRGWGIGGNGNGVDRGVSDVNCVATWGEGDAVGLDETVGEDLDEACRGDEAVDSRFELRVGTVVKAGNGIGIPCSGLA